MTWHVETLNNVKNEEYSTMSNFNELKEKWLKDPSVRKAYFDLAPEFELANTLISARVKAGLTQADVALPTSTLTTVTH
jgi:hypothetical protein